MLYGGGSVLLQSGRERLGSHDKIHSAIARPRWDSAQTEHHLHHRCVHCTWRCPTLQHYYALHNSVDTQAIFRVNHAWVKQNGASVKQEVQPTHYDGLQVARVSWKGYGPREYICVTKVS